MSCLTVLLIEMINSDPMQTFEQIYKEFEAKIFRFVYGYVGNYEDATDLTQEVFIKVYAKHQSLVDQEKLSAWIYRIAANQCKNFLLRKKIVRFISLEWLMDEKHVDFQAETPNLEIDPESSEVEQLLLSMDAKYREVLLLREVNELSYQEISEVLSLPLGTVKVRISRGREQLKQLVLKKGVV